MKFRRNFGIVWEFETKNFLVQLEIEEIDRYKYDGDDEDGEIQELLDKGKYVAFDSTVTVYFTGNGEMERIGSDNLGGSVYDRKTMSEFWTLHRDSDPMNRNCSRYRQVHGENSAIGHYFPDMVREAVTAARQYVGKKSYPVLRVA